MARHFTPIRKCLQFCWWFRFIYSCIPEYLYSDINILTSKCLHAGSVTRKHSTHAHTFNFEHFNYYSVARILLSSKLNMVSQPGFRKNLLGVLVIEKIKKKKCSFLKFCSVRGASARSGGHKWTASTTVSLKAFSVFDARLGKAVDNRWAL